MINKDISDDPWGKIMDGSKMLRSAFVASAFIMVPGSFNVIQPIQGLAEIQNACCCGSSAFIAVAVLSGAVLVIRLLRR